VPLPAGNYAQVRPVPSANTGGQPPFANQLDLTDGRPVTSKSGALGKHHLTERPLTDFG
jgi:hypothetical protein